MYNISKSDSFYDIQKKVAEFSQTLELNSDVNSRCLDLTSELGELAKEALHQTSYGTVPFFPSKAWRNELGDVMFSLVCLANQSEADLAECLSDALNKYQSRLDKTGSISSTSD